MNLRVALEIMERMTERLRKVAQTLKRSDDLTLKHYGLELEKAMKELPVELVTRNHFLHHHYTRIVTALQKEDSHEAALVIEMLDLQNGQAE